MAKYKHADDDPPALKNGKVTPITGSKLKHIPRLKIACDAIIPKNPIDIYDPHRSQDFAPI